MPGLPALLLDVMAKKSKGKLKTERRISSGGVIYKMTADGISVALIETETKKGLVWSLPKGMQENHESLARTAHREVKEETGLDGKIVGKLDDINYFYIERDDKGAKRIFKIVYFFLMEYASGTVSSHDREVIDCRWFPIDEAVELVPYNDEKDVLRHAKTAILSHKN